MPYRFNSAIWDDQQISIGGASTTNLTIAGAATGSPVTLTAAGSDTNEGIEVVPKGAAGFIVGNGPVVLDGGQVDACAPNSANCSTMSSSVVNFPGNVSDYLSCTSVTTGSHETLCAEQPVTDQPSGIEFDTADGGTFQISDVTGVSTVGLLTASRAGGVGLGVGVTLVTGSEIKGFCKAAQGGCSMGAGATACTVACTSCQSTWSCFANPFGTGATVDAVGVSAACATNGTVTLTAKTGPTTAAETFNVFCTL
jgi:hypothetical protein